MCVLLYKMVLGWWLHFKFRLSRSRKRDEVATSSSAAVQGAHLHCHVDRVVARVFGKHTNTNTNTNCKYNKSEVH